MPEYGNALKRICTDAGEVGRVGGAVGGARDDDE